MQLVALEGLTAVKIFSTFFSEFQTLSWRFKPNNGNNSSNYDYKILKHLIRKQQKTTFLKWLEKTNTASYNRDDFV